MGLRNQLIKDVSGIAGLRFINLSLGLVTSILLARHLGPDGYGAYAFILALIGSLALLSYAGLPQLLVREIARYEQAKRWGLIRGMLLRGCQFSGVLSVLTLAITALVSGIYFANLESLRWWLLFLGSPLVPIIAFSNLRAAVLQGLRRVVFGAMPEMLIRPAIFLLVFGALISVYNPTPELAIVSQIVGATVAFVAGLYFLRNALRHNIENVVPEYHDKEWISSLVPFTGIAGVSYLNSEFVTLFLGISGTNDDVAILRVAVSLGLIVALPLTLVESIIRPYLTRLYSAGDSETLQRLTQIVSLCTFLASLLPATVFVIYGEQLISMVYGGSYIPAYSSLVAVVLGYTLVNVVGLSMVLLYSTDFHASAFKISTVGAVLTIILCILLVPAFGVLGAAIVVGFGKAIRATLFVFAARRHLGIRTSLIW